MRFDGRTPGELTQSQQWAWHDTLETWHEPEIRLSPEALTVFKFNTRIRSWGVDTTHSFQIGNGSPQQVTFSQPDVWLSAVTFLGDNLATQPTTLIVHVANRQRNAVRMASCQIWLPKSSESRHVLAKSSAVEQLTMFPEDGRIPAGEKGGFIAQCTPLPLTYGVIEVKVALAFAQQQSLFAHLRIKPAVFDISGGWIRRMVSWRRDSAPLVLVPYVKTFEFMHINTGHTDYWRGFSDDEDLSRYPLKLFDHLTPVEKFDNDRVLPCVHAVDAVGRPQFGSGRRWTPSDVFRKLAPYQATRLPTSVTHTDERVWRCYAGLSDYPNLEACRVNAPAADAWLAYDRWDGQQIRWGAPLETIGDLTRSLRELNRPMPIACWSQAAHTGWGLTTGRSRAVPTPDELRAQAYQALANRITSLYWFNVNLESLVEFPDLIAPITCINREIRLMDHILVQGDAYEYRRVLSDGKLDWDLSSIASRDAAVLFANDLAYHIEADRGVFQFESARDAELQFRLPLWLRSPAEVFRMDAAGTHNVECAMQHESLTIRDRVPVVGIYIVAREPGLREQIQQKHAALLAEEQAVGFDPSTKEADLQTLRELR